MPTMFLVRVVHRAKVSGVRLSPTVVTKLPALRSYGSHSKSSERTNEKRGAVSTDRLIPGSEQRVASSAIEEYNKCESKMKTAVEWYKNEVATIEVRASGRVTPALLSPVRVVLPDREGQSMRLEEVAMVGVKDGSMLLVTVFEEKSMKHVEEALYDSKIPGVVPQRADATTLRIPISQPTVEMRTTLITTAQREAENTRVQIRKSHQASLRKSKVQKHSQSYEEFQKMADKYVGEVDKILANLKKGK